MFQPAPQGKEQFDYVFKVVVAGDSDTGKTCLLWRWVTGQFKDKCFPTVGMDTFTRTLQVNNTLVKLEVWDTAGMERYRTLSQNYFNSVKAAVVVYDVTSESSLEHVHTWLNDVDHYGGLDVLKVVVGNKSDLTEERPELPGDVKVRHTVTHIPDVSAKKGTNVDVIFSIIAKKLEDKYNQGPFSKNSISLGSPLKKIKKCNCLS